MLSLPKLNLPPVELRLRRHDSATTQVWDALRHRWLKLTPEEWVRQHFLSYLIGERGVEAHRIVQEHQLLIEGRSLRADIVVYAGATPQMVIECKSAEVEITQDVFDQVAHYNTVLGARFIVVTNGMKHYCCQIDHLSHTYTFIKDIPQL